jgi:hypothetical protein
VKSVGLLRTLSAGLAAGAVGCSVYDTDLLANDGGADHVDVSSAKDVAAGSGSGSALGSDTGSGLGKDAGSGSGSGPSTKTDAAHDGDAGAKPWQGLAVVQTVGSTASSTVSFQSDTTAGNLLVALASTAAGSMPSGAGWKTVATSPAGDVVYIYPNNPGGLKTFTVDWMYMDIILVEFSGAPPSIALDGEANTGADTTANVSTLSVTGSLPKSSGELELLFLDTLPSTSASADGWTPLGTDGDDDFAWWRAASSSAPSATSVFSPPSSSGLMLVTLEAN